MLWVSHQISPTTCVLSNIVVLVHIIEILLQRWLLWPWRGRELIQFARRKGVGEFRVVGGDVSVASVLATCLAENGLNKGRGTARFAIVPSMDRFRGAGAFHNNFAVDWKEDARGLENGD